MNYVPQAGDIGLSYSPSKLGLLIRMMQSWIGDWAIFSHAFIVLYDGEIIEAMPKGARFARLDQYRPDQIMFSRFLLTPDQRDQVCEEAIRLHGTPYSFLDYLALGLDHFFGNRWVPRMVKRRVKTSGKMICSQLAAEAYKRAGVDILDGKDPQECTPGDLNMIIMMNFGKSFPEVLS